MDDNVDGDCFSLSRRFVLFTFSILSLVTPLRLLNTETVYLTVLSNQKTLKTC